MMGGNIKRFAIDSMHVCRVSRSRRDVRRANSARLADVDVDRKLMCALGSFERLHALVELWNCRRHHLAPWILCKRASGIARTRLDRDGYRMRVEQSAGLVARFATLFVVARGTPRKPPRAPVVWMRCGQPMRELRRDGAAWPRRSCSR